MQRRVVNNGRLKAVLMTSEEPEQQMQQLMTKFDIKEQAQPFTICLECNQPLVDIAPANVKDRVPPYVYKTQTQYMECPTCGRVYWRGTHWLAMLRRLEKIISMKEN
jgi:hypothetical protein